MPAKSGTFFNAVNNFLTVPLSLKAKKKKKLVFTFAYNDKYICSSSHKSENTSNILKKNL